MNTIRFAAAFAVLSAAAVGAAAGTAGCSGDPAPSGADASADSTVPDAGVGNRDAERADVGEQDAGADGPAVIPVDAGNNGTALPHLAILEFCNFIGRCCDDGLAPSASDAGDAGDAGDASVRVDAGAWNVEQCAAAFETTNAGGFQRMFLHAGALDGGKVDFDPLKGGLCLGLIRGFYPSECTTLHTDRLAAARIACYEALSGTLAVGSSGCRDSIECAQPAYCDGVNGAVGTCRPLIANGGACTAETLARSQERCSGLATGVPSSFCDVDAGACAAARDAGDVCSSRNFYACKSQNCVSSACSETLNVNFPSQPTTCNLGRITDAGGGG